MCLQKHLDLIIHNLSRKLSYFAFDVFFSGTIFVHCYIFIIFVIIYSIKIIHSVQHHFNYSSYSPFYSFLVISFASFTKTFISFFFTLYLSLSSPFHSFENFLQSDYRNPHLRVQILLIRLSRYFLLYFSQEFNFLPTNPIYSVALDPVSFRVAYAEIFFRVLAPSHHSLFIPFRCYCICTSQSYLDLARSFEHEVKSSTRVVFLLAPVFSVCLVARIPSILICIRLG